MSCWDFSLGVFSGLLAAVVGAYFQDRSTKATLRLQQAQDEKNLKLQLLHDDRTEARKALYQVIDMKYESYRKFERGVQDFLQGVTGGLIPAKIADDVRAELTRLNKKLESIEPPEPSDAEVEHWDEDYAEFLASLPPEERVEYEVNSMAEAFKSRIKKVIREDMSEV